MVQLQRHFYHMLQRAVTRQINPQRPFLLRHDIQRSELPLFQRDIIFLQHGTAYLDRVCAQDQRAQIMVPVGDLLIMLFQPAARLSHDRLPSIFQRLTQALLRNLCF